MTVRIEPYRDRDRAEILALSMRSWAPVFAKLEPSVPAYVYRAFYPEGWEARQAGDIAAFLDEHGQRTWVAFGGDAIVGWVGVRVHPEDAMGEVYILAVDPDRQREGVASALIETALEHMRAAGMRIAMVETGDDPGHSASRATYERTGFERWPVARYFRKL